MKEAHLKINVPTCSGCHNPFDAYYHSPRIVPKCGHTFCEKCITNRVQSRGNRKIFVCMECESDTTIRKIVSDQFPRNTVILDVLKDIKKQTVASSNIIQPESPRSPFKQCSEHNKPIQFKCQTCKGEPICSHCAIFGKHKNHTFIDATNSEEKLSPSDLQELKRSFEILRSTVIEAVLPGSPKNILQESRKSLKEGLKKIVKLYFRQYYQPIERREQQMLKQCEEIQIQGGIQKSIDRILNEYQLLKLQFQNITQSQRIENGYADEMIGKAISMHDDIQILQKHADEQVSTNIHEIAQKINSTIAFRLQQLPFTLKSLCTLPKNRPSLGSASKEHKRSISPHLKSTKQQLEKMHKSYMTSQPRINQVEINKSSRQNIHKTKENIVPRFNEPSLLYHLKADIGNPSDSQFISDSRYESVADQVKPEARHNMKLEFKQKNQANLRPSTERQNPARSRGEKTPIRSRVSEKLEQANRQKVNSRHTQDDPPKTPKNQKKQALFCSKDNADLKYTRPMKEIGYELRPKLQELCDDVNRQHQEGSGTSLQLIGRQINDTLLWYIVEHLRANKLQFSMVKLVKNGITDQGFRILMSYLSKDNYTKVLNMTGNQISSKGLVLLIQLAQSNNILKTIYLTNNKVSPFHLKAKKAELQIKEIEVIL